MRVNLSVLLIVFSLLVKCSYASHIVGANITYSYDGTGTLFKVTVYRDCGGIQALPDAAICFTSASGCDNSFTVLLPMDITTSAVQVPFNPCNGIGPTSCNGGSIYSFEEYNYIGYVTVPPCDDWTVTYFQCCRNIAVTNMANSNFTSILVETKFDNLNYPTNSSPQFNVTPVNYYCLGVPSIIDFSATDVDGDSLVYEFAEVLEGDCNAPMVSPFLFPNTITQPLAVFTPTIVDPFGGQIQFTPSALQNSVVGFRVKEYRNGNLIGSVKRDDEVMVVGSYANPDTIAGRVYYDLNLNNVFDGSDLPAGNVVVELTPGTTFALTAASGKYDFQVPAGTYTLDVTNVPPYMNLVNPPYTLTTTGSGTFIGNHNFGLQPIPNMNDLVVSINNFNSPAAGQNLLISVNYENAGTTVQNNATIEVTLDPTLTFVISSPAPSSIAGNVITWTLPTLNLFSNGTINMTTNVDPVAVGGTPVNCSALITSPANEATPLNNSDSFTDIVSSTFPIDPNHKSVIPSGDIPLSFVTSQQWLNYKINFQNIGTAPAQIIRIQDLLDFDLDFGTLELVASSYPCAMILQSQNNLEFNFFGINLTPAFQNVAASQGFVEYRIKPKTTVPVNSLITNQASITFDFNAPIYTNVVHNRVVVSTDISTVAGNDSYTNVFPNPANEFVTVELENIKSEQAFITINNLLGSVVYKKSYSLSSGINEMNIPVNEITPGVYFLNINWGEMKRVMKIIIQE